MKTDTEITRGDSTWWADQVILSSRIKIYADKNNVKIFKKKFKGVRLDRSGSGQFDMVENNFDKLTDFHAFHKDYMKNWDVTESLIKNLFDANTLNFFENYFVEFRKLVI